MHHEPVAFACPRCRLAFETRTILVRHEVATHGCNETDAWREVREAWG